MSTQTKRFEINESNKRRILQLLQSVMTYESSGIERQTFTRELEGYAKGTKVSLEINFKKQEIIIKQAPLTNEYETYVNIVLQPVQQIWINTPEGLETGKESKSIVVLTQWTLDYKDEKPIQLSIQIELQEGIHIWNPVALFGEDVKNRWPYPPPART
jgi:hypothetical protein